ncbi:MAG: hypothetical protein ACE5NC_12970, partial [Anaerolineae bacterium]
MAGALVAAGGGFIRPPGDYGITVGAPAHSPRALERDPRPPWQRLPVTKGGSPGPAGCNMCGGIVSESLVQALAVEGINLPPAVVQRGIDVLHTGDGTVKIDTPLREKRIAAVHRGGGPRDVRHVKWGGLDGYLLTLGWQGAGRPPSPISQY